MEKSEFTLCRSSGIPGNASQKGVQAEMCHKRGVVWLDLDEMSSAIGLPQRDTLIDEGEGPRPRDVNHRSTARGTQERQLRRYEALSYLGPCSAGP